MAPLSPSNFSLRPCWKCQKPVQNLVFCASCEVIQPVPEPTPDYFSVLGLPVALKVDEALLRNRFYELAKKIHPDRFLSTGGQAAVYATRWTTLVNRAYQTLEDPRERSLYLLELFGVTTESKSAIPMDLAEAYFDLQDDPQSNYGPFKQLLDDEISKCQGKWQELADSWETKESPNDLLPPLRELLSREKTLRSLAADLEKRTG